MKNITIMLIGKWVFGTLIVVSLVVLLLGLWELVQIKDYAVKSILTFCLAVIGLISTWIIPSTYKIGYHNE